MKKIYSILFATYLFVTASIASSQTDYPKNLLGTWEYRQPNGNNKYDKEGEKLRLLHRHGQLEGTYFGLEREGEHGLFYTVVDIQDLNINERGEISFTVPPRHLFQKRPKSLEEAKRNQASSRGFTKDELEMKGNLENGKLTLRCQASVKIACPAEVMVFQKNN